MIKSEVIVISPSGLHLRPAVQLLKAVSAHQSDVRIQFGDKEVRVDSILNLLKLELSSGSRIKLLVEGPDEEEAMRTILRKLEQGEIVAAVSR